MKTQLQKEQDVQKPVKEVEQENAGDTCCGVQQPKGEGDYICVDCKWVRVDVP